MVVVLPATKEMCMIRKPSTLKAKARFSTVPKEDKMFSHAGITQNKVQQ
jgi:hypothetical protein